MSEQNMSEIIVKVENEIKNTLDGNNLKHALDFVAHMSEIGMMLEMDYHPTFKYMGEWACLLVIIPKNSDKSSVFGICSWPGELDVNESKNFPIDDRLKDYAHANVKICFNCGGCKDSDYPGPLVKTVFGKEYNNVCCNAFHFFNPSDEQMENAKKLMQLLKHNIVDTKEGAI